MTGKTAAVNVRLYENSLCFREMVETGTDLDTLLQDLKSLAGIDHPLKATDTVENNPRLDSVPEEPNNDEKIIHVGIF